MGRIQPSQILPPGEMSRAPGAEEGERTISGDLGFQADQRLSVGSMDPVMQELSLPQAEARDGEEPTPSPSPSKGFFGAAFHQRGVEEDG